MDLDSSKLRSCSIRLGFGYASEGAFRCEHSKKGSCTAVSKDESGVIMDGVQISTDHDGSS